MLPKLIRPRRYGNQRSWLSETYNRPLFEKVGTADHFLQKIHSFSALSGAECGFRFQAPPHGLAKLVRCRARAIWDAAVDPRLESSPSANWVGARLTTSGAEQLYVPVSFTHASATLTDNAEVRYKASEIYAPDHEAAVHWNDPRIAIQWTRDDKPATLKLQNEIKIYDDKKD